MTTNFASSLESECRNSTSASESDSDCTNEEEQIYMDQLFGKKNNNHPENTNPQSPDTTQPIQTAKLQSLYHIQTYLQAQLTSVQNEIAELEMQNAKTTHMNANAHPTKNPKPKNSTTIPIITHHSAKSTCKLYLSSSSDSDSSSPSSSPPPPLSTSPLPSQAQQTTTPTHPLNPFAQLNPLTPNIPQATLNLITPPSQPLKTIQELRAITDLLRNLPKPTP